MEFFYRCSECDRQFEITPDLMLCPDCRKRQRPGYPLRGVLEVALHRSAGERPIGPEATGADGSIGPRATDGDQPWWSRMLPVEPVYFPPLPAGGTPLWEPARLREKLGLANLYLKDDTGLPTGSLKDRASALVAAFARRHEIESIVVASTGNAASSMAGVGAAAGLQVTIFVPSSVPRAKLVQSLQYGARVEVTDGSYDDAYLASLRFVEEHGGMSRNTAYNPMTIEGKKTVLIEIFDQLGRVPDALFVPTGDGVILGGVYKGLEDLVSLGLSESMPTVYAVQASGSNAISRAVEQGEFEPDREIATVADSISVGVPANGYGAVRKLKQHDGRCVEVSDDQILDAQIELSRESGLFAEPAAAASYAGLLAVREELDPEAVAVLLVTGSGLKDIDSASLRLTLPTGAQHG